LEDKVFNELPLLLAVPRAASILGISRAAAYRLVATGELPVRRLGRRVYVVTSGLRELVASLKDLSTNVVRRGRIASSAQKKIRLQASIPRSRRADS
jgi:predicted DNA-binding transcriptional regulator AlpA